MIVGTLHPNLSFLPRHIPSPRPIAPVTQRNQFATETTEDTESNTARLIKSRSGFTPTAPLRRLSREQPLTMQAKRAGL